MPECTELERQLLSTLLAAPPGDSDDGRVVARRTRELLTEIRTSRLTSIARDRYVSVFRKREGIRDEWSAAVQAIKQETGFDGQDLRDLLERLEAEST